MERVYLSTQLPTPICHPVFERFYQLVSSRELGTDHLQQLVEFSVICACVRLDFCQEVVICECGRVVY
jgi:hypothetical protein